MMMTLKRIIEATCLIVPCLINYKFSGEKGRRRREVEKKTKLREGKSGSAVLERQSARAAANLQGEKKEGRERKSQKKAVQRHAKNRSVCSNYKSLEKKKKPLNAAPGKEISLYREHSAPPAARCVLAIEKSWEEGKKSSKRENALEIRRGLCHVYRSDWVSKNG